MSTASDKIQDVVTDLLEDDVNPGIIASALMNWAITLTIQCGHADEFLSLAKMSFDIIKPVLEQKLALGHKETNT